MADDRSQIETRGLRLCDACQAEPRECDKFCRRCGTRLGTSGRARSVTAASTVCTTSPLSQDSFHQVSGRLIEFAVTGISYHTAPLHNRLAKRLISALISIPIWLIIVLLSPLDAYATAKK